MLGGESEKSKKLEKILEKVVKIGVIIMRKIDEKIEKNLKESIHSVEIECGKMSEEEIELLRQEAYGEITRAEYFIKLKKLAKEYCRGNKIL